MDGQSVGQATDAPQTSPLEYACLFSLHVSHLPCPGDLHNARPTLWFAHGGVTDCLWWTQTDTLLIVLIGS